MTEKNASASATLRISHKDAVKFCKVINRKKLDDAKNTLNKISNKETTLDGKVYKKITDEMTRLLNNVESNARKKNLDTSKLFVFVSTHRGPTMHRNRRRWRKFGSRLKSCHVQLVLSDKENLSKKAKKKDMPKKEKE